MTRTTQTGMQIDSDSWDMGFECGDSGGLLADCPFSPKHDLRLSWLSGYIEGKGQREKRSDLNVSSTIRG